MDKSRTCGCKGCRTCLLCENDFGLSKEVVLNKVRLFYYTFFVYCLTISKHFRNTERMYTVRGAKKLGRDGI